MTQPALCGVHTAFIYERGGSTVKGQLTDLEFVRWQRIRDDISRAQARIGPYECCTLMSTTETVKHELHIFRDGELVWCGPITRLEFEDDGIDIFAEDIMWVPKRRALERPFDYRYGEGDGPTEALDLAEWLLLDQCFLRYVDEWNMEFNVSVIRGPDDPQTTAQANAWSQSVWETLDHMAQYSGIDYTVVARQVFAWDVHLDWNPIADLDETHIGEAPRIVEYGNQYGNRIVTTDGSGYAGVHVVPGGAPYSQYVDLINRVDEQSEKPLDPVTGVPEPPTPEDIAAWVDSSEHQGTLSHPPPRQIVVPANTSLMPASPWYINTLMPGSWFTATVTNPCRSLTEYQRLQELNVEESGENGENVSVTTISAPSRRVTPP